MAKPIKADEWTLASTPKKKREKKVTERTGEVKRGEIVSGGGHASLQSEYNHFAAAHRAAEEKARQEKLQELYLSSSFANFKKARQVNQAFVRMGHPEEADKTVEEDFSYDYVETDKEREAFSRRKRVQKLYREKNKK